MPRRAPASRPLLATVTPVNESRAGVRLEFLDGIRAIAALYVVLHHIYLTVYPHNDPSGPLAWTFSWLQYGNFGVAVFIVISGYSLAIRPARIGGLGESYLSFIRRRFRRIVLPYWVALAVSLVLALTLLGRTTGTHWDVSLPVTWQSVVVHLLALQDVAYSATINHVFWSVALEWHIYFLFPLLLWFWSRRGKVVSTAVLLLGTTLVAAYAARSGLQVPLLENLHFVGLLAVGALCCYVSRDGGTVAIGGRVLAPRWDLVAGALVVVAVVELVVVNNWTIASTLVGLAMGAALIAMSTSGLPWLAAALARRPVVWLGTISFSLYLTHALVIQLIWQYVLAPSGFRLDHVEGLVVLIPVGAVVSVLLAWAFWSFGERPFLSNAHKTRVQQELRTPVHSSAE